MLHCLYFFILGKFLSISLRQNLCPVVPCHGVDGHCVPAPVTHISVVTSARCGQAQKAGVHRYRGGFMAGLQRQKCPPGV